LWVRLKLVIPSPVLRYVTSDVSYFVH
jgi:hypothetical protein